MLPEEWSVELTDKKHIKYVNKLNHYCTYLRPVPLPGFPLVENEIFWPFYFRSSHILMKHKHSRNPESRNRNKNRSLKNIEKEDARKKLEDILKDIREKPQRFEEHAVKHSDDSSYSDGGDLKWSYGFPVYEGLMDYFGPKYTARVVGLKPGEISDVFETDSGFHIAKRTDYGFRNTEFVPDFGALFFGKDTGKSVPPDLFEEIYNCEVRPLERKNWISLLQKLKVNHVMDIVYYAYLKSFHFFHCSSQKDTDFFLSEAEPIWKNASERNSDWVFYKYLRGEGERFYSRLLLYTCHPEHWEKYFKFHNFENELDSIAFTKRYLHCVGFSADEKIWAEYLRNLKKYMTPDIVDECIRCLFSDIRFYDCDILDTIREFLDGLNSESMSVYNRDGAVDRLRVLYEDYNNFKILYDRKKQERYRGTQSNLTEEEKTRYKDINVFEDRIKRRKNMARDRDLKVLIDDKNDDYYISSRESLNSQKEVLTREDIPIDVRVDLVIYSYKVFLSKFWWIPDVWVEFWCFLVDNKREEQSDILNLAFEVFKYRNFFKLKYADCALRLGFTDDAIKIYKELLLNNANLRVCALTLLFRTYLLSKGLQKAQQCVSEYQEYITPQFLINAAKLSSRHHDLAWSLYQLGIEKYLQDSSIEDAVNSQGGELLFAAIDFLQQNSDVRNIRNVLQQAKSSAESKEQLLFKILKRMMDFEIEMISPISTVDQVQRNFNISPNIKDIFKFNHVLNMHRYRYLDLYPVTDEELIELAHLYTNSSADIVSNYQNDNMYITSMIPYKSKSEKFLKSKDHERIRDSLNIPSEIIELNTVLANKKYNQNVKIDIGEIIEDLKKVKPN